MKSPFDSFQSLSDKELLSTLDDLVRRLRENARVRKLYREELRRRGLNPGLAQGVDGVDEDEDPIFIEEDNASTALPIEDPSRDP